MSLPLAALITRREALIAGLQLAAYAAFPRTSSIVMADATPSVPTTLKAAGALRRCQIGTATSKASLQNPAIADFVARNFNLLTASGMKWHALRPGPETYNFAEADWNIGFAEKNGMSVHGHNLCWNSPGDYPAWFKPVLNKSNAAHFLTSHITTVMKRYQGRIDSWDVVNEPVVPWPVRNDGLYPGIWLDLLGPEYIDIAFHAAALADPKPLRVLNIHHVEQGIPDDALNRSRALTLLKKLIARKVPVQAVGLESHLDTSKPLGQEPFLEFIREIRGMGLEVVVTELDVKENRAIGTSPDWDQEVAKYYKDYIAEILLSGNPRFVIFWSLDDRWEGNKRIQGLTWGHHSTRLSYHALMKAFQ
jgi:endo-1,4-beta-xylanase